MGTRSHRLVALFLLTSCELSSPPLDEGPPAATALHASRSSVDLGRVRPGARAWTRLRLENPTSRPVTITARAPWPRCADGALGWCAAARDGHWDLQDPVEVPAGAFARIQLGFRSLGPGKRPHALEVSTCALPDCVLSVPLDVEALHESLVCTPSKMSFGSLPAGSTVTRNLDCTVLSTLSELVASPVASPFRRGPHRVNMERRWSATFEVEASLPSTEGVFSATFEIRSRFFEPERVELEAEVDLIEPCVLEVEAPERIVAPRGGASPPATVLLKNSGLETCAIGSVRFLPGDTPSALGLAFGDEHDLRLGPAEVLSLPLHLDTRARRTEAATLRIEPGGSQPSLDRTLFAEIRAPIDLHPVIVPSELDFGRVPLNCRARSRSVTVYNAGSSDLYITAAELRGDPSFALQHGALGEALAPGRSFDVGVGMRAERLGPMTATVALSLAAVEDRAVALVSVKGQGTESEEARDDFVIRPAPPVDLAIFVDPTLPAEEAARFARAVEALPENDLHVGVTTTAVGPGTADGRFLPLEGPGRVLTSAALGPMLSASLEARLRSATSPATASERGLEALYRAFSAPHIFGANSGFYRQDSLLASLFLTARTDTSSRSADFYFNHYRSLRFSKGDLQRLLVVGGPSGGCRGRVEAVDAERYRTSALRLHPSGFISICDDDAPEQLGGVLEAWAKPPSRFFLAHAPRDGVIIEVILDGQSIPRTDASGESQWTYLEDLNAIELADALVRAHLGAEIIVRYPVHCL